jgi:hypothetical protein
MPPVKNVLEVFVIFTDSVSFIDLEELADKLKESYLLGDHKVARETFLSLRVFVRKITDPSSTKVTNLDFLLPPMPEELEEVIKILLKATELGNCVVVEKALAKIKDLIKVKM